MLSRRFSESDPTGHSVCLELHQLDRVASFFLPTPGEFHNFLYRLVGMKRGGDEAASVRAVSHNKFINQMFYSTGTFSNYRNQDDAVAKARLHESLQQVGVRDG